MSAWFVTSWTSIAAVLLTAVAVYATVIVVTRLYGLRSYSKLSGFDFAMTIAIGTVIGTTILSREPPLLQGLAALVAIYLLRWLVSVVRVRSKLAMRLIDNRPILLMRDGRMLRSNMRRAHVTEGELRDTLRQANVMRASEVRAVVLERAGEMSVLHGDGELDDWLLEDVEA